jgi:hypothetical protein
MKNIVIFFTLALCAFFTACNNNQQPQQAADPKAYAVDALQKMHQMAQTTPQILGEVGQMDIFNMMVIAGDSLPQKAAGGYYFESHGIHLYAEAYKLNPEARYMACQTLRPIFFVQNGLGWWATKWDKTGNSSVELVRCDTLANGNVQFTAPVGEDMPEKWHVTIPK